MNSTLLPVLVFQQFLTSLLLRQEPIPLGQLKYLEMLKVGAALQSQSAVEEESTVEGRAWQCSPVSHSCHTSWHT